MENLTDLEKRTLTIKRLFDAPRQLVWDAWTQAEHIIQWWGPPGMETTVKKHEFKVGGEWEYTMVMGDGKDFITFGKYTQIVPPELLETTANFLPMTEGVTLLATFKASGDQTEFTFKVIHPTEEYCKQQEQMGAMNGWGSVFDRLAGFLQEA